MRRRRVTLVCLCVVLGGCVAPGAARRGSQPVSPSAIVAAVARREAATRGLRLSMSVRLSGTEHDSLLPSPAYLAIDDSGAIRLQVLSPFGMTVLDLAIRGETYTLTQHTTEGVVDLRSLSESGVAVSDRMIVALAMMFRPKARPDVCRGAGPAVITCPIGAGLHARVTVDASLRPIREEYGRDGAQPILVATFADYLGDDANATPGSLRIEDTASGARMTIHVQRARIAAGPSA